MNLLCPNCRTSVSVVEGARVLRCDACGTEADISSLGTAPGVLPVPVVRDMTGASFGPYRLEALIGMGGMGVVYRARDTRDERTVAVKVLNPDYQWKQEEFVRRFEREIKALRRLEHPSIVRILDAGEQNGFHFLVTEFVDGEDLAVRLRKGPLPIDEAVRVMSEVCAAMTHAHLQGIVHRDIKPANIILSGTAVKVLDFGLAQVASLESKMTTLTRTDLAMGTFNYLSPEQRLSAKSVDHRADIFSLGVVFYEMLTGTLPLGSFAPPSKVRKDAPGKCDRIVDRSLKSSPELRYPDAAALGAEVRSLLKPTPFRRKAVRVSAGAASALAIALFFLLYPKAPPLGADDARVDSVELKAQSASANRSSAAALTVTREQEAPSQAPPSLFQTAPQAVKEDQPNQPVLSASTSPEPPKRPAARATKPDKKDAAGKDEVEKDAKRKRAAKKTKTAALKSNISLDDSLLAPSDSNSNAKKPSKSTLPMLNADASLTDQASKPVQEKAPAAEQESKAVLKSSMKMKQSKQNSMGSIK